MYDDTHFFNIKNYVFQFYKEMGFDKKEDFDINNEFTFEEIQKMLVLNRKYIHKFFHEIKGDKTVA